MTFIFDYKSKAAKKKRGWGRGEDTAALQLELTRLFQTEKE
jgi:hypothetical protein